MSQGQTESNDAYHERFKSNASTVELAFRDHVLFCEKLLPSSSPTDEEIAVEKDRFKAMLFLKSSDDKRYGGLKSRLNESATLGRNEYPKTLSDMYELMCSHIAGQSNNNSSTNRSGTSLLQHELGVMLTQANTIINPNWILLDTCSTNSVFNNDIFLTNVKRCKDDDVLHIVSNDGGSFTYDTIGHFGLLDMPIYYNKDSLANVLSFKQVAALDNVKFTLDTSVEKAIVVHISNKQFKFKECRDGLYFLNTKNIKKRNNKNKVNEYPICNYIPSTSNFCLVNTVENKKVFL